MKTIYPSQGEIVKIEIQGEKYEVPGEWICPITCDLFASPVMNKAGHRFERSAISAWLQRSEGTWPLTRQPVRLSEFIPDRKLQHTIESWKLYHGIPLSSSQADFHPTSEEDRIQLFDETSFAVLSLCDPSNIQTMQLMEEKRRRRRAASSSISSAIHSSGARQAVPRRFLHFLFR